MTNLEIKQSSPRVKAKGFFFLYHKTTLYILSWQENLLSIIYYSVNCSRWCWQPSALLSHWRISGISRRCPVSVSTGETSAAPETMPRKVPAQPDPAPRGEFASSPLRSNSARGRRPEQMQQGSNQTLALTGKFKFKQKPGFFFFCLNLAKAGHVKIFLCNLGKSRIFN